MVASVAMSAEAVAPGSYDRTARIWPISRGSASMAYGLWQSLFVLQHPHEVSGVDFMAGGVLATGCFDGKVRTYSGMCGDGPAACGASVQFAPRPL